MQCGDENHLKTPANRLKECLPSVISQYQSAFITNKLSTDNVIVAHEAMHSIRKNKRGSDGLLSIKIDMSKAYDRVEWRFLKEIMMRLGFHSRWVNKIMFCVETVRYRIKINGKQSEEVEPKRGLKQGDPLSPYLFLLCQELFSFH